MNLPDEDLQRNIEKGHRIDDSLDSRGYQKVFNALRKEPYRLPPNFADRVMTKIEVEGSLSNDYFWFGLGLFTFITGAVVAALLANFKFDLGTFKFIRGYSGLFLFGLTFILLIHYIDKRLLSRMISNR